MRIIRNKSIDTHYVLREDSDEKIVRGLYYFCKLLHKQELSAASTSLRSSPRLVLKQITKLESYLGLTLIEIRDGVLYVTPYGESVFKQASPGYFAVDNGLVGALKQIVKEKVHNLFNFRKVHK